MLSSAALPSRRPGMLLIFILITGAITLMLSGAVERVAHGAEDDAGIVDDHGTVGDAGVVDDHAADNSDDHNDTAGAVTEDHSEVDEAATDDHSEEEGHSADSAASPPATDDHSETVTEEAHDEESATTATHDAEGDHSSSVSLLGIDLSSLNLAYPRLAVIAAVLTIIVAVAYAFAPMTGTLGLVGAVSALAVVASVLEATHAGEEHGIFIPLPALAAVLYGGAGIFAALRIAEGLAEEPAPEHTGH